MKTLFAGAFSFLVAFNQLHAADRIWTGAGADNNWSTTENWGGTVPADNDNLIFNGAARQNNFNDLADFSARRLTFSSGGFVLSGNPLELNPSGSAMITNLSGTNTIALDLSITAVNKNWFVAPDSELRLAGGVANSSSGNPIITLKGGGTLRITSPDFVTSRAMTLNEGAVIVDGGFVDHSNDGIRFVPAAGVTVETRIENDGVWRIGGGGNFRMGFGNAASGSLSRMTLNSGTLELYGSGSGGNIYVGEAAGATSIFNQNGGHVWCSGGNTLTLGNAADADGTYNLNGGTLEVGSIQQGNAGAAQAIFNFNGGTLKPVGNAPTFFQGLQSAFIDNGGAIIDTTNFNVTIAQNLQAAGSGALKKMGAGTLELSGANSYTGSTIILNGTLDVTGSLLGAGAVNVNGGTLSGDGTITGPVVVLPGATLSPGNSVGTLHLKNDLTLAGNLSFEVNKSATFSNDFVQVDGQLANVGTGTVSIINFGTDLQSGDHFQFFNQPLANGNALNISPASPRPGLAWTNRLAVDGSVGIVSVPILPTPADLVGLTLSAGTLDPEFNSNKLSYAASVVYTNRTISLNPVAARSDAVIRIISGDATNTVVSGENSDPLSLKVGTNIITVSVTAFDQSVTKDYVVTIKRISPNIIVILADDQGFSDWSCYGGEISTPNLDRLAGEGLRFRQFYNAARCSPTRCALLTGLYTQQAAVDPAAALPNLRYDNNVTIAELLQANGYRTYHAGKWHLGNGAYLPEFRGFDQVWRYTDGNAHSEDTWKTNLYKLISSNGEITNRIYGDGEFYQPDAIGDYTLDYINNDVVEHAKDKPFFIYMAFGSAHFPIQAPKDWVDTNAPIYAAGWDAIRYQRYTNMLAQGVIDPQTVLSPTEGTAPWNGIPPEEIPAWNALDANRQADLARRMAVYAAMIQKMDANIGRVVNRLRELGQLDNTLIFALSDNGGNFEGAVFGQTGGVPDPTPLTGSDLSNMGLNGQPIIYLGGGWAHVSDTPFRLYKHFDHEGGIRTPMIVHWPQGLTRTNEWETQPGHLIDVMATIVDVTGVDYPTQYNEHVVLPLEGQSLQPLFNGTNDVTRTLGFEHEGNRAWISGSWKFVTKNFTLFDGSSPANELELYDLSKDPTELTNVANAQPAILNQLVTNWNAWATRVGLPAGRLVTITTNLPNVTPASGPNDLFLDTFARPNNNDIDVSDAGMSGSDVPPLGANATYYEGFEGSGSAGSIQVQGGALRMAVGVGMSESGIEHNFIDPEIISAGGFSIEMTVQEISSDLSDIANRYAGFGVGLSEAEAATGADVGESLPAGKVSFRGKQGGNTGVTDFFVELDLNGNVKVWSHGVLLETVPVGQTQGTLTASFALSGFGAGDQVTVDVFFNGERLDINSANANSTSRTFQWNQADENYIGLSARASDYVRIDNFAIRRLPLANTLAADYALRRGLSGADSALDADPDGDGVSNFGEWAFGGDPAVSDPAIAALKGTLVTPMHDFQFEYQRLTDHAGVGLRYRYFVSDDLKSWTETTPDFVSVSDNEDRPGYEIVTLQLPANSLNGQDKLFLRVLAEPAN